MPRESLAGEGRDLPRVVNGEDERISLELKKRQLEFQIESAPRTGLSREQQVNLKEELRAVNQDLETLE